MTFEQTRSNLIGKLIDSNKVDDAFRLARQYQDYKILVQLSVDDQRMCNDGQIKDLVSAFGEEFAFVLFDQYLENGTEFDGELLRRAKN